MIAFLTAVLTLLPLAVSAQVSDPAERKAAVAVRVADNAVRMDGRLTEAAWNEAQPITDLVQKEPVEGAPPTERMDIRILYDDSGLYIGARMFKKPGSPLQAPVGRRDRGEQTEHILVALDTFHDRHTAYVFGVTASGVRLDRFHAQDDEATFDEGYDPVWTAKTTVDEEGWVAELWIPFSQLRFNPDPDQVWGLNVHRYTPTLDEDDYWVPVPRTVAAWSSRFGELRGIKGLTSNRRLELLPYAAASSTVIGTGDPANPFRRDERLQNRGGADLKMGIGPNLTLDATINPDFGQVEADPAVVNLTAFETIFAEKRPFFTEGANLFNLVSAPAIVGSNFFYSRRIGAPPTVSVAGDFVAYPQRSTIIAAGKLTGRLRSGTSVGLLAAVTDEETARVSNRASPVVTSVRVAPRTGYLVARVQQEYGRNHSTSSGLVSILHRDLGGGDPLAALLVRNAVVVGGDSRLRFKGGEYEVITIGGITYLEGEPAAIARVQRSSAHFAQRPDKDYARYDPTLSSFPGFRMGGAIQRTGGRHWLWNFNHDYQSPGVHLNELGRLRAGDGIKAVGDLRYRETVPGKTFRSYAIGVRQNNEWTFGGERQVGLLQLYGNQTWRNYWTTESSLSRNFRRMDAVLTRGGPLMEGPGGWTASSLIRNRASASTSWSGQVTVGATEDGGHSDEFEGHFTFRPGPRWQLSIAPTILRQVDMQQYIATLDGGTPQTYGKRYVFSAIDRSTYSTQFRLTFTLKPDVNVDVYAEPFAASGRYYDAGELLAAGTRARRKYGTAGTTAAKQADGRLLVTDGPVTFTLNDTDFNVRSFRSNVVLRWEYRAGTTLYFVWQQDRQASEVTSERVSLSDSFGSLRVPGNNYFVVKTSFWLPVR